MKILHEVVASLKEMHDRGFVHRDIHSGVRSFARRLRFSAGNVMLKPDGAAVLVDMGLARRLKRNKYQPQPHQTAIPILMDKMVCFVRVFSTRMWQPPEHAAYSTKSDMWQFALLAREMLTGDNENEISVASKHLSVFAPSDSPAS